MSTQYRMTFSSFLFSWFHSLNRHHACSSSTKLWWCSNRRKLYAHFRIEFPMINIGTVHYVIIIVQSHKSILLLLYLLLIKIIRRFAIVSTHFEISLATLRRLIVIQWRDVRIRIWLFCILIKTSMLSIPWFLSETICFSLRGIGIRLAVMIIWTCLIAIRIFGSCKLYVLILQLFLDKLLGVS